MSEIHDSLDDRNIKISNVGICDYKIPFIFINGKSNYITIANIKSSVSLSEKTKGAHLSRIIETIDENFINKKLTINHLKSIVKKISENVGVDNANLEVEFIMTFMEITPKSEKNTYVNSKIKIYFKVDNSKILSEYISMSAMGAMLCPNSKAKSKYGAHSQKCDLTLTLNGDFSNIIIKEYYDLIAKSFSAPVFGIVKSVDEIYMTEYAYDHPKFSEDVIRDLLTSVREKYKSGKIKVELQNHESIHQHDVFANGEI